MGEGLKRELVPKSLGPAQVGLWDFGREAAGPPERGLEPGQCPLHDYSVTTVAWRPFFFFFRFIGPHLWHMEVPRQGVQSEL